MPVRSRIMTRNQERYTETGKAPASRISMTDSRVVRLTSVVGLLVQRGCIFGFLIYGTAFVVLGQQLLDLPIMLLDTDRKLEIFTSDRIPVLLKELAVLERLQSNGRPTLYTIMTASRLQIVAKKSPSR
jgi:hypothetical protein